MRGRRARAGSGSRERGQGAAPWQRAGASCTGQARGAPDVCRGVRWGPGPVRPAWPDGAADRPGPGSRHAASGHGARARDGDAAWGAPAVITPPAYQATTQEPLAPARPAPATRTPQARRGQARGLREPPHPRCVRQRAPPAGRVSRHSPTAGRARTGPLGAARPQPTGGEQPPPPTGRVSGHPYASGAASLPGGTCSDAA